MRASLGGRSGSGLHTDTSQSASTCTALQMPLTGRTHRPPPERPLPARCRWHHCRCRGAGPLEQHHTAEQNPEATPHSRVDATAHSAGSMLAGPAGSQAYMDTHCPEGGIQSAKHTQFLAFCVGTLPLPRLVLAGRVAVQFSQSAAGPGCPQGRCVPGYGKARQEPHLHTGLPMFVPPAVTGGPLPGMPCGGRPPGGPPITPCTRWGASVEACTRRSHAAQRWCR